MQHKVYLTFQKPTHTLAYSFYNRFPRGTNYLTIRDWASTGILLLHI